MTSVQNILLVRCSTETSTNWLQTSPEIFWTCFNLWAFYCVMTWYWHGCTALIANFQMTLQQCNFLHFLIINDTSICSPTCISMYSTFQSSKNWEILRIPDSRLFFMLLYCGNLLEQLKQGGSDKDLTKSELTLL